MFERKSAWLLLRAALPVMFAVCIFLPGCAEDEPERRPSHAAPAPSSDHAASDDGVPSTETSWTCMNEATAVLTPVRAGSIVADRPVVAGSPEPSIASNASPASGPWGTTIEIRGTGLGDGRSGEYVSIGSGAHEIRIPATCPPEEGFGTCRSASWGYDDRVSLTVPLFAEGEVVVHTKGGAVNAGTFTPTWRATPRFDPAGTMTSTRIVASLSTSKGAYALLARDAGSDRAPSLTIVAFRPAEVASLVLPSTASFRYGTLAGFAEAPDGTVDLLILSDSGPSDGAGSLRHVTIRGDDVEIDDACVPALVRALAVGEGVQGPVAWVHLPKGGVARLTHARASRTWSVDRGPFGGPYVQGRGVEAADGAVAFAWAEPGGGSFDDKASARAAWLGAGAASFEFRIVTPMIDDYVRARMFATARGFTLAYCNDDSTSFFGDKGSAGERCRVETLRGKASWETAPGYPEEVTHEHEFGQVGDAVVAVHHGPTALAYRETPTAEGSSISNGDIYARAVFIEGRLSRPQWIVTGYDGALAVVGPR